MRCVIRLLLPFSALIVPSCCDRGPARYPPVAVGTAVVDVTPSYPIRLMGYGSRQTESEGVASPLKVRAIAIGEGTSDTPDQARRCSSLWTTAQWAGTSPTKLPGG